VSAKCPISNFQFLKKDKKNMNEEKSEKKYGGAVGMAVVILIILFGFAVVLGVGRGSDPQVRAVIPGDSVER
jgi:hypothetical protein